MRLLGAALCATLHAGCGAIEAILEPPVIAALTVFNRTEMEITLVSGHDERLVVPACGQARDGDFRIDELRVGANELYVRAFRVGLTWAADGPGRTRWSTLGIGLRRPSRLLGPACLAGCIAAARSGTAGRLR